MGLEVKMGPEEMELFNRAVASVLNQLADSVGRGIGEAIVAVGSSIKVLEELEAKLEESRCQNVWEKCSECAQGKSRGSILRPFN